MQYHYTHDSTQKYLWGGMSIYIKNDIHPKQTSLQVTAVNATLHKTIFVLYAQHHDTVNEIKINCQNHSWYQTIYHIMIWGD